MLPFYNIFKIMEIPRVRFLIISLKASFHSTACSLRPGDLLFRKQNTPLGKGTQFPGNEVYTYNESDWCDQNIERRS